MEIEFTSEGFPSPGPVQNGGNVLSVTWNDLLWAAITVGRPNRHFVFQHGVSSLYEALFRASALRMSLEQTSAGSRRLRRTSAAKSLDPSEKGAINYFLGLTFCKLFAEMELGAPWLLHLDVFRDRLNPRLLSGRSRPDLVGLTHDGKWLALESKGRVSQPTSDAKTKAKEQAERIISVGSAAVTYRIGGITFFKNDILRFFWRDPRPDGSEPPNEVKLAVTEDEVWRLYYQPILRLLESNRTAVGDNYQFAIQEADFNITVLPEVIRLLRLEKWKDAANWCIENHELLIKEKVHRDGLKIVAGQSWIKPFENIMG